MPASTSSDDLSDVALAVLAGGEGSRMGRPKIELTLGGQPILHALLDRFDWPGPTVLSAAAGHASAPGAERFDRIIRDRRAGQGPLQGLHDVLADSPAPHVVVTAVDMPFVRREQLAWLAAALKSRCDATGLMLARPLPGGARVEPLPSAFRASFAPVIARLLRDDRRSLHGLAAEPAVHTVAPPDDWPGETWTNLNTPADLSDFEKRRGR